MLLKTIIKQTRNGIVRGIISLRHFGDITIRTTHGKIRGKVRNTAYNDKYYCFDGVPYAKPPLGALRFKAPQPLEAWTHVLNCTKVPKKPFQYNIFTKCYQGSEDCLYLNIYAKKLESQKPLPVMVYFFGGSFSHSDGSRNNFGPDYFMMKDVILISVNFRLGALGFLSFKNPELQIPGNASLKDMLMALKWIKSNCAHFNGDAENITVFGHSSGTASMQGLMLCEKARGFFHKAILMSGGLFNFDQVSNINYRLACANGFKGKNNELELYDYFMQAPAEKLTASSTALCTREELLQGYHFVYYPCIEPYLSEDTILAEDALDLLPKAWSNNIPIMLGYTSSEGLTILNDLIKHFDIYEYLKKHPEYILPTEVQKVCEPALAKRLGRKLITLHFGEKSLSVENVMCAVEHKSYLFIVHKIHRNNLARLAYSRAPTFFYRFDFDSPHFNLVRNSFLGANTSGVAHGDEMSYLFWLKNSYKLQPDIAEYKTIERMLDIWTTFAATSNPNCDSTKHIKWHPIAADKLKCLNISHDLSFIDPPELEKCKVWDSVYIQANKKLC